MKRFVTLAFTVLATAMALNATGLFFTDLTEAQRYDLADAYNRVADRYDELDDADKSLEFRNMAEVIFPGFATTERPNRQAEQVVPSAVPKTNEPAIDPAGADASYYYFNKLLRGVFNENIPLTLSVLAETLYLPLYDAGIDKATVAAELNWFFKTYNVTTIPPQDVFNMDRIVVTPLNNGFWRLDLKVKPEYVNALPKLSFWFEKMGFYFQKFPEGWRLAAIGPIS